jgi:hypothetical protein
LAGSHSGPPFCEKNKQEKSMKTKFIALKVVVLAIAFVAAATFPTGTSANHSWNGYHWARTSNPFTIKLGDSVSSQWDSYLATAASDWNASSVLNTTVIASNGTSARKCTPTAGRVEVCNTTYGRNGWLGIASIWASGQHITQGSVKMNDTYYNTAQYNTPAWRRLVMCQEIGHTFGLDHQDENFSNTNLGTCMDYTNDPDGGQQGASNEHPNTHDYQELDLIYQHLDSTSTVGFTIGQSPQDIDTNDPREWGMAIRANNAGRPIFFERDFGNGRRLFTFVYWAEEPRGNRPD